MRVHDDASKCENPRSEADRASRPPASPELTTTATLRSGLPPARRRRVASIPSILLVVGLGVAAAAPVQAEDPIHGTTSSDTLVYGDILHRFKYNCGAELVWYCENLGPGVCRFTTSASEPYRGSYQARDADTWSGTGQHKLYGDDPGSTNYYAQDYIYPADQFASDGDIIGCGGTSGSSEYYISIGGSLSDCGCSSSATAAFASSMWIIGDAGLELAGGDDYIWGWDKYDIIEGNGSADRIHGGGYYDDIYGDGGNDYLWADTVDVSYEMIDGGPGNDHIYGADDSGYGDHLYGGTGNDQIVGYAGRQRNRRTVWRIGHRLLG
jgi:hypothetical protein